MPELLSETLLLPVTGGLLDDDVADTDPTESALSL